MRDNLILTTGVTFGKGADQGKFRMVAYTGAPVDRYFGKLAIDIDGIKSKTQMPIFRQHEHTAIVGHSNKVYKKDGAFVVEGKFSDTTSTAREVRALAAEGFPWQASIGVSPKRKSRSNPALRFRSTGDPFPALPRYGLNPRCMKYPLFPWVLMAEHRLPLLPLLHTARKIPLKGCGTSLHNFKTSFPATLRPSNTTNKQKQRAYATL